MSDRQSKFSESLAKKGKRGAQPPLSVVDSDSNSVKRLGFVTTEEKFKALKILAAEEGINLKELMNEAIDLLLASRR